MDNFERASVEGSVGGGKTYLHDAQERVVEVLTLFTLVGG
jgi:hypothetical protein